MPEQKLDWKKLLEESRRLEKEKVMSEQELAKMKKCSIEEAQKLKKMLAEAWFVRGLDAKKAKSKKK